MCKAWLLGSLGSPDIQMSPYRELQLKELFRYRVTHLNGHAHASDRKWWRLFSQKRVILSKCVLQKRFSKANKQITVNFVLQ